MTHLLSRCRFFGLYSLILYGRLVHVVVINNVFEGVGGGAGSDFDISERFDLKGSKINRRGKLKDGKG